MGKILELKQALGLGARANKYHIGFNIPDAVPKTADLTTFDTLCVASSIPGKEIGVIEVYNQGRKDVLPGDTAFSNTWTTTFYNTEEHNIRRAIIEWQRSMDHFQDNMHSGVPIKTTTDLNIKQLDSAQNETVRYTFHYAWPQSVSEISVGDDQQDTITQFDVTWAYTDWVIADGTLDKPLSYNEATKNWIA